MTQVLLIADRDEHADISQHTLQCITAARMLIDPQLTLVIVGDVPSSALSLPVERVVSIPEIEATDLGIYDQVTSDISALVAENGSDIVIFTKTDFGSIVGARMAFRSGTAFAPDCLEISNESGTVSVTRPVYGGSALAEYEIVSSPAVVTLRPGSFLPSNESGSPALEVFAGGLPADRSACITETVAQKREGIRLEDAAIVVSGGRGLGGPEPFSVLAELADTLGGALGASRAACDAGWIDHSHQVGLTGKSVSPDVYIAVGISGASQHMAGCSSSRVIVAINKDADSNIFNEARFGVVGDWEKVLPSFAATIRELKA